jgi:hypothetical protein
LVSSLIVASVFALTRLSFLRRHASMHTRVPR